MQFYCHIEPTQVALLKALIAVYRLCRWFLTF